MWRSRTGHPQGAVLGRRRSSRSSRPRRCLWWLCYVILTQRHSQYFKETLRDFAIPGCWMLGPLHGPLARQRASSESRRRRRRHSLLVTSQELWRTVSRTCRMWSRAQAKHVHSMYYEVFETLEFETRPAWSVDDAFRRRSSSALESYWEWTCLLRFTRSSLDSTCNFKCETILPSCRGGMWPSASPSHVATVAESTQCDSCEVAAADEVHNMLCLWVAKQWDRSGSPGQALLEKV